MMKRNKEYMIKSIMENTNRPEAECIVINDILESHNIIGHNNKDKIKADFVSKLNMSIEEADDLYNLCSSLIVKGIFRK